MELGYVLLAGTIALAVSWWLVSKRVSSIRDRAAKQNTENTRRRIQELEIMKKKVADRIEETLRLGRGENKKWGHLISVFQRKTSQDTTTVVVETSREKIMYIVVHLSTSHAQIRVGMELTKTVKITGFPNEDLDDFIVRRLKTIREWSPVPNPTPTKEVAA